MSNAALRVAFIVFLMSTLVLGFVAWQISARNQALQTENDELKVQLAEARNVEPPAPPSPAEVLQSYVDHESPKVQASAVRILAETDTASFAERIKDLLGSDTHGQVVAEALHMAQEKKVASAFPEVGKLLTSKDAATRRKVASVMAVLGPHVSAEEREAAVPHLLAALNGEQELRDPQKPYANYAGLLPYLQALGAMDSKKVVDPLVAYLNHRKQHAMVRRAVAVAMEGQVDLRHKDELMRHWAVEPDLTVREALAVLLTTEPINLYFDKRRNAFVAKQ